MLKFLLNLFLLYFVDASTPTWVLNDGNKIPVVALGTFGQIKDPSKFTQATIWALQAGYRHIDTAAFYLNEQNIGEGIATAIKQGIVTREEIFVTTKLNVVVNTSDGVLDSIKGSLRRLKLDYVDLYIIHWPNNAFNLSQINDVVDIWKGMEETKKLGLAKSIGVSNFDIPLIDLILTNGKIPPAVNQIEINLNYRNSDIVTYCQDRNITILGYAPMGFSVPRPFRPEVNPRPPPSLKDPVLTRIAKKYGVSTSQVILRSSIDRGIVPIIKSFRKDRIVRNVDLFGFNLTAQELSELSEFNKDQEVYPYEVMDAMCLYIYNYDLASHLKILEKLD